MMKNELESVRTQLKDSEDALQEAMEEKRRLDTALAETNVELDRQRDHSLLEKEMKRKLSAVESRESSLREQQRLTLEQLKNIESRYKSAMIEVDKCKKAKNDAQASLATAKESCRSLRQQIQQTQRQLKDAESSYKAARTEAERCNKAKLEAEASLGTWKQRYQNVSGLSQRENNVLAKTLVTELKQSKEEIKSLKRNKNCTIGEPIYFLI